ncbi:phosphatidylinositol glycan anchor biosynthesis class S [Calliopsis andreniformis]|uniref:phosphatidylinositol glycan anchor biosynthesis class S n=1 Tax=Calliopsis andreniformis TaxID=337506 RepID=UPI003FCCAE02
MKEETDTIGYDTAEDEKYRIYASISFVVLLLGIGVPLWWHTTTVPRVALPYAGIERLSDLDIKIQVKLIIASHSLDRIESLARDITEAFKSTDIYRIEVVNLVLANNLLASAFTYRELEKVAIDVGQILLLETDKLNDTVLVGSKRTLYFSKETTSSTLIRVLSEWMLREKSLTLTKNALAEPTLYSLDEENRRRFPASPAYDVLITLVNPNPEKLNIDWNLHTMTETYVEPFLAELSMFSNFSVKSQWLYLLPLEVNPKLVLDSSPLGRHFALPEDVLPQVITPLEKKLASQVSLHPTINFVIYAVPCDNAPLHIYTRSGHRSKAKANVEAFLSPRWGGIVLVNPSLEACAAVKSHETATLTPDETCAAVKFYESTTLTAEEARAAVKPSEMVTVIPEETTVVGTFLAQLKLLLGIPEPKPLNGVNIDRLVGLKIRDWEVDALLRIRTIEQLTTAKLTLQSLARLLTEIRNIVITEVVGNRIKTALHLIEESATKLTQGDLSQGFQLSKEAFVTAEAAFSDPTLLALLYFPEDQKYAVYIPLFLPAMIPVLLSLKNIYRYYYFGRISKSKED